MVGGFYAVRQDGNDLGFQLAALADVRRATSEDDCVYDNSMGAFFREHAHPSSWYAVEDAGASVSPGPGVPWKQRLSLERGRHLLAISQPRVRLLWQPRDGTSRPRYWGPMNTRTFSQL